MDDREDVIGTVLSVVALILGIIGCAGGSFFSGTIISVISLVLTIAGVIIAFKAKSMMFNSRSLMTIFGIAFPILGIVFSVIGVKDFIQFIT